MTTTAATTPTNLIALTRAVFDRGGPLEQALAACDPATLYTYNPEQVEYAAQVADALIGEPGEPRGRVSLLEGETGIGKSLGYLVPLCLHAALTGRRHAVSTFKLNLQTQLLTKSLPVVAEVVRRVTGKEITYAVRKGRRNFPCLSRIKEMREKLRVTNALTQTLADFLDNLEAHTLHGRDFQEWINLGNDMPDGVTQQSLCLWIGSDESDERFFREHVAASKRADILVMTHALALRAALGWMRAFNISTDFAPYDAMVLDEADGIPAAAASVYRTQVSVSTLKRVAEGLEKTYGSKKIPAIGVFATRFAEFAEWAEKAYPPNGVASIGDGWKRIGAAGGVFDLGERDDLAKAATVHVTGMFESLTGVLLKMQEVNARHEDMQDIGELLSDLKDFQEWAGDAGAHSRAGLSFSPAKAFPSLEVIPLIPGRLAGRLWVQPKKEDHAPWLRVAILTSATLDAPSLTPNANQFKDFRYEVGVYDNCYRVLSRQTFAPAKFGVLDEIVLAPRDDGLLPILRAARGDEDGAEEPDSVTTEFNPAWAAMVADAIQEAYSMGGRLLVLDPSFAGCSFVAASLKFRHGLTAILHEPGKRLDEYMDRFLGHPSTILITPSGYEGLDLPGALRHVMLTRIPFVPPSDLGDTMMSRYLTARGKTPKEISAIMYGRDRRATRRKTKQALGRPHRSVSDRARFWIMDPRFPLPTGTNEKAKTRNAGDLTGGRNGDLAACIPARFRIDGMRKSEYSRARIFAGNWDALKAAA